VFSLTGLVLSVPKVECVESNEAYGRFIAEPLDRGFSITLGNSLRRVLQNSLIGAAVTSVEIGGIHHEFSTIPHAKEDALDFLLNIRAIRIRSLSQRSGKMSLEIAGEGEVTAADIKPSADFEIVNPELHLISMDSSKAKLSIELNVELGRGYLPARSSDGLVVGVIPIDAIFTPVRKVSYSWEASGSAEGSNQEKLILEVWTDGTIAPIEAVSQAATILRDQISCFLQSAKELTQEGEELSWQRLIPPEQYNAPLDQLNLSTHTYNSLRRGGITTLGQVLERRTTEGLSSLAGFGAKSQEEVEAVLTGLNLPVILEEKKVTKKRARTKAAKEEAEEPKEV
jgi:DNA-directed RNA polymerase subunit alpha